MAGLEETFRKWYPGFRPEAQQAGGLSTRFFMHSQTASQLEQCLAHRQDRRI